MPKKGEFTTDSLSAIAREYSTRFPEYPRRTLARMMVEDNPGVFLNLEQARSAVRRAVGVSGDKSRKIAEAAGTVQEPRKAGFVSPVSTKALSDPIHFNEPTKWLVIGDLHMPFHDQDAVEVAMDKGKEFGCESLYINGDGADNIHFSKWFKDPLKEAANNPAEDLEMFKGFLADAGGFFPGFKVMKQGNHEDRWDKALIHGNKSFGMIPSLRFREQCGAEDEGYTWVESAQLAFLGKLPIIHGHELPRGISSPVNPARGAYVKIKDEIVTNHFHKPSTHLEPMPIADRLIVCRSVGCLCQQPTYSPLGSQILGFATVEVFEDGRYEFRNYAIYPKTYEVISL